MFPSPHPFRAEYLRAALTTAVGWLRRLWRILRGPQRMPVIEVLLTDRTRRRAVEATVRGAVERLRRALDGSFPADAIVVQEVLPAGASAQSLPCVAPHEGSLRTLIRLALRVADRRLDSDELLAALADQVALLAGEPMPVPVIAAASLRPEPGTVLPPDPLAVVKGAVPQAPRPLSRAA